MMNTPIYDTLVEMFEATSEDVMSVGLNEPEAARSEVSEDLVSDHEPVGEAAQPATACYWCGVPIWEDSERHEWLATDPVGGETVPITACSAEHLGRLQAAAGRAESGEPAESAEPATPVDAQLGGATTPLSLPAPDAPVPQPPALHGETEPLVLSYRPVVPVEVDDDELAAMATAGFPAPEFAAAGSGAAGFGTTEFGATEFGATEFAAAGFEPVGVEDEPYPGHEPSGAEPSRSGG